MIHYTLNNEPRTCKTQWEDVSLWEYLQILGSESQSEAVAILSGLTIAEVQQAHNESEVQISEAQPLLDAAHALLSTEPSGYRPEWLSLNLGTDGVGRLELCRKYLRENEEQPERAYPFLYAVYAWPDKYNAVLAISGAGFPAPLIEEAKALPVTEAIGAIYHILQESNRLADRYGPLLSKEPTEEQYLAGVEKFEKYGFYTTLVEYAGRDLTRIRELMEVPADVFYTSLCIDAERADYEEKYQKIISNKQ